MRSVSEYKYPVQLYCFLIKLEIVVKQVQFISGYRCDFILNILLPLDFAEVFSFDETFENAQWRIAGASVKKFSLVSKKFELVCFSVKIWNFVFFGVKNLELVCFLVSAENGAGVSKMTNIMYEQM